MKIEERPLFRYFRKNYLVSLNLKKKLNKEDYPQPYYKPPKILSTILSSSCKGGGVFFSIDELRIGNIFSCKYEYNKTLSEGDIINIRTDQDVDIEGFDSPFSFNVTILIELDPL